MCIRDSLNTISFTGTIQGVQTAANEYFNKDVSELTLWELSLIHIFLTVDRLGWVCYLLTAIHSH